MTPVTPRWIGIRALLLGCVLAVSAQAQTLGVSPGSIPVNQPSLAELTLAGGSEVFGIIDATIQGGVIQVIGGTFAPPDPKLIAVITASGSPSPAMISVTVATSLGPQVWTGSINVAGPPQNPPVLTVTVPPGVTPGATIAAAAPTLPMAGYVQPFTGAEAFRVSVINATTGAEFPCAVVPNPGANRADWNGSVDLVPGNNALFVFAHDDNCVGCSGTLLPFTATFGAGGGGLALHVPTYINQGAVMGPCQGEPVNPLSLGFGGAACAGGC